MVAGNTMQDGGLVVMGENNSLRVFESSPISPIVDELSKLTRRFSLSRIQVLINQAQRNKFFFFNLKKNKNKF